jgi:hypothetical protein
MLNKKQTVSHNGNSHQHSKHSSHGNGHHTTKPDERPFLIIRYNDDWKFWWDVVVLCLAVIVCFILPVEIAFEPPFGHSSGWKIFEIVTEILFSLDVIFHFNTSIIDRDGNEEFDRRHIALHYVKEYHLWIDLASVISIKNGAKILRLLPTLKVIRIT